MGATNYDDDIASLCQFNGCVLALFGRLTNRVGEPYFGGGKPAAHTFNELPYFFNGLGGLSNDPEASSLAQLGNVFAGEYDIKFIQIPDQTKDFHMVASANHHRMKPLANQVF